MFRHPCLGSARLQRERPTFVTAKVGKATTPDMTVLATSSCLDCPTLLVDRAPARTRTFMCSNMRALLARSAAMLGVMQRRGSSPLGWRSARSGSNLASVVSERTPNVRCKLSTWISERRGGWRLHEIADQLPFRLIRRDREYEPQSCDMQPRQAKLSRGELTASVQKDRDSEVTG